MPDYIYKIITIKYGNTPLHEVMHALGWWHEQQRGDRDQHVKLWRERRSSTFELFL